jgi:hypothetical protein
MGKIVHAFLNKNDEGEGVKEEIYSTASDSR